MIYIRQNASCHPCKIIIYFFPGKSKALTEYIFSLSFTKRRKPHSDFLRYSFTLSFAIITHQGSFSNFICCSTVPFHPNLNAIPHCFIIAFAVKRDFIFPSTVTLVFVMGLYQISWSPFPCLTK